MIQLALKIGDRITHLKRGSTYEVFARTVMQDKGCEDGQQMYFTLEASSDQTAAWHGIVDHWGGWWCTLMCMPLLAQISEPGYGRDSKWLVYRSIGEGDTKFFARPEAEFTDDRFEKQESPNT